MDHGDKRTLASNFGYLMVVQCANYLLPLITLPYLFRVLTAEKYGLIVFAQAFTQYFVILTDYGFSLSATREVSTHRADRAQVSRIFCSVMVAKLALLVLSFLLLLALTATVPKFRADWQVYLLAFGAVAGHVLFPLWLFQGLERMKYIALLHLVAKLVFTALVFAVVREKNHYVLVPLFNALGFLVMGILGLSLALTRFGIRVTVPSVTFLWGQVKAAHHVFVGQMATSLYTTSNVVILGFFADDATVGYFAAGEKIVRAVQGLEIPFSQAAYPYVSKLASQSPRAALSFIREMTLPWLVLTGVVSGILFVWAGTIAQIVLGQTSEQSAQVIRILAPLPLVVGWAILYANLFLVGFGFARTWSRIILSVGTLSLIGALFFVAVLKMSYVGLCLNVVLTEVLILLLSYLAYRHARRQVLERDVAHEEACGHADR